MESTFDVQHYGHVIALGLAVTVLLIAVAKLILQRKRSTHGIWVGWVILQGLVGLLAWQALDLFGGMVVESLRPILILSAILMACLLCGVSSWAFWQVKLPNWAQESVLAGTAFAVFALGVYGASQDHIRAFEENNFVSPAILLGAGNHQLSDKQAITDLGRPIALYTAKDKPPLPDRRLPDPGVYWPEQAFGYKLIRTAPPDPDYNCHGWVFTASQYILSPEDVQRILEDNGYYEVQQPVPGDVVIYYDPAGMITHTALVRAVGEDGFVLVESKWGCSGARYLHLPELWFSARHVYYRTNRGSHVVRGLEQNTTTPPLAVRSR